MQAGIDVLAVCFWVRHRKCPIKPCCKTTVMNILSAYSFITLFFKYFNLICLTINALSPLWSAVVCNPLSSFHKVFIPLEIFFRLGCILRDVHVWLFSQPMTFWFEEKLWCLQGKIIQTLEGRKHEEWGEAFNVVYLVFVLDSHMCLKDIRDFELERVECWSTIEMRNMKSVFIHSFCRSFNFLFFIHSFIHSFILLFM